MNIHNENEMINVTALIPERIKQRFKKNLFCDRSIPALEKKAKQLKFQYPELLFCHCCENFFIREGKILKDVGFI